jgi:hypothetical protein
MASKKKGKGISLELKKTIDVPDAIKVTAECTFRAARYFDIFLHLVGIN